MDLITKTAYKGERGLTIRHLRVFVAVCRARSVTRAAEALHMTQPAVTRAVQELERYYGVRLFERINRRLSPTACGERFYAQALHIVDSFDGMERGLRNWEEHGVLRVGATITLGTVLLPEAVAAFQRQHPGMRVEARVARGEEIRRALHDNRIDLALIEGGAADDDLVQEPLSQDRLVLITPPDDPLLKRERLLLADLRDCRLLLRETGSAGRALLEHVFAVHGVPLVPIWESASTRALVQAVAAGLGIAFLPERLVRDDLLAGRVCSRPVEDEPFRRDNGIVWHRNKFLTPSALAFLSLCHALSDGLAQAEGGAGGADGRA